jgi:hypothetical protein
MVLPRCLGVVDFPLHLGMCRFYRRRILSAVKTAVYKSVAGFMSRLSLVEESRKQLKAAECPRRILYVDLLLSAFDRLHFVRSGVAPRDPG